MGCCNPGLYESDEFVVIQNTGDDAPRHHRLEADKHNQGIPDLHLSLAFPLRTLQLPSDVLSGSTGRHTTLLQADHAQDGPNHTVHTTLQQAPGPVYTPNSDRLVDLRASITPGRVLHETGRRPAGLPCHPAYFTPVKPCWSSQTKFTASTAACPSTRGREISGTTRLPIPPCSIMPAVKRSRAEATLPADRPS